MIGMLVLACFVTGFITAWLVRTGFVMTQISWAQEPSPSLPFGSSPPTQAATLSQPTGRTRIPTGADQA